MEEEFDDDDDEMDEEEETPQEAFERAKKEWREHEKKMEHFYYSSTLVPNRIGYGRAYLGLPERKMIKDWKSLMKRMDDAMKKTNVIMSEKKKREREEEEGEKVEGEPPAKYQRTDLDMGDGLAINVYPTPELPLDIIRHHLSHVSKDFLGVTRKLNKLAYENLEKDFRLSEFTRDEKTGKLLDETVLQKKIINGITMYMLDERPELVLKLLSIKGGYKHNARFDSEIFHFACKIGGTGIVRYFLNSDEFDVPPFKFSVSPPLVEACTGGHLDIVKLILRDDRFDPGYGYNKHCVNEATIGGFSDIVWELVKHPKVDLSWFQNLALRTAIKRGYGDIVKMLLEGYVEGAKKGVVPDNHMLHDAVTWKYFEIIEILALDGRVDMTIKDNEAIKYAIKHKRYKTLNVILDAIARKGQKLDDTFLDEVRRALSKK